jgi:tripartite-type tricarboxylate transporter receptor subunit TctC
MPEVKQELLQQGAYTVTTTPEQAQARLQREIATWAQVIKDANIRPD